MAAAAGGSGAIAAIAASVELELVEGKAPTRIKLLPMGEIQMRDGRGPYRLRDSAHAEQVVAATRSYFGSADMPGDYDHQMLYAVKPGVGGKAKASAWVKPASISVEADGIYANDVAWTPAAAKAIEDREYRYISPLFMARPPKDGGDVVSIKNFALVGIGAIDLPAIAAGATGEEEDMDLSKLALLLGLAADAGIEAIAAAVEELKKPKLAEVAAAAGLEASASVEAIAAAITDLRNNSVPKAIADGMKAELETLRTDRLTRKVDELVAAGVLIPAKRTETLAWFKTDEVAATAFFKDMPPVLAPGGVLQDRQTQTGEITLTADEVAACARNGWDEAAFLEQKKLEVAA